jgi:hypothetical protein
MWNQFYELSINCSTNTSSWGHLKKIAVVNIFNCGFVVRRVSHKNQHDVIKWPKMISVALLLRRWNGIEVRHIKPSTDE